MAIIEFDNGQRVEFDGNPTQNDVEEVAAKLGIKSSKAPAKASPLGERFLGAAKNYPLPLIGSLDIAAGMGKDLLRTALGGGEIVEKAGTYLAQKAAGGQLVPELTEPGVVANARTALGPSSPAQEVGAFASQVGQIAAPLPGAQKANALAKGAGMARRIGAGIKKVAVDALEQGGKATLQSGGDVSQTITAAATGAAVPLAGLGLKKPLTSFAKRLYGSAAKFTDKAIKASEAKGVDLVKTGLQNRVFLTQGGVDRVAAKIDEMEGLVGKAIDDAGESGIQISTIGLGAYIDEAKNLFKHDFDIAAGQAAVKELDSIKSQFLKQYGNKIPIKEAQKIKVATGQRLAKYFGRLTDAGIEGRKAGTRYLKEKIAEAAPDVGEINKRLSALYQLDKALESSMGRIMKLNLLGLGTKVLASSGQPNMMAAAGALQVFGSAMNKSGIAIGMNELAKLAEGSANAGKIPAVVLTRYLEEKLSEAGGG
jgi:hypothetical protein